MGRTGRYADIFFYHLGLCYNVLFYSILMNSIIVIFFLVREVLVTKWTIGLEKKELLTCKRCSRLFPFTIIQLIEVDLSSR